MRIHQLRSFVGADEPLDMSRRPPPFPLSVLYPQQRQMPPRLRVFIAWLVEPFE
ncbi:hypothetical protein GCM10011352_11260 [Marinobacterium zhoushanense]|uniref:LysR substrate binding domain-containing protein n=2 Tax=Marinobacterium zhoushanense TaxID=1679163 RepID=A0ABQ1K7U6_9GAMM|nr:hypothetical protein GCM10011352_11260 [Marinobacterium zhoushanense]